MAYYAYKNVRDAIPDDFRVKYEKEWLEETGKEFEGSADYDGDLWHMAAAYIEHLEGIIVSHERAMAHTCHFSDAEQYINSYVVKHGISDKYSPVDLLKDSV